MVVASMVGSIGYMYASSNIDTDTFRLTSLSLVSSLLLTIPDNDHARYFATFCITSGTYTTIGIIIAWCMYSVPTSAPLPYFRASPYSCP
jgi:hypothetical protein